MAVVQPNAATKKGSKRQSMAGQQRPSSGPTVDEGFNIVVEGDGGVPAPFRAKLHLLFHQIEKEFELLYMENQSLHEKVELLNERIEREVYDRQNCDTIDFDTTIAKVLSKKCSSTSGQKVKTADKLKAQTSKIVSSLKGPHLSCSLVKEYIGHKDGIWEVSVSRNGQPIMGTASADHSACIWSIDTTKCLLQYNGHTGSINSIRFHPIKDLILTGSGDCSAHIWQAAVNWDSPKVEELEVGDVDERSDIKTAMLRTPVCELSGHTNAISAADWLAGAEQVITASWDRLAILHDVETRTSVTTLSGHDLELTHTATHPSQKLAVTSSRDTTFRLWDFRESIQSVSVFQGHSKSVSSAVFAREDKVVSGSDDRTAKVWDLRNMRSPVATIRLNSAINRIAVSSGGVIAVPQDNMHVRFFDLTGQRLARVIRQGHDRMIPCVAWADELHCAVDLLTCGFDRRVLGWALQSLKDKA